MTFALALALAAASTAATTPAIEIAAANDRQEWTVGYRLEQPATILVFARSPDGSRARDWLPEPGFEIVRVGEAETARRVDGRPFESVRFTMKPAYAELPMDYAPFSPFGDGGMAFHTGRFFACAGVCPDNPRWRMRLTAPGAVLLDGERHSGSAAWDDLDSGRSVYVGGATPVESPHLLAVFDAALPGPVRAQLVDQLPRFMDFFAARLGSLERKPMLFASYDATPQKGGGRQGGTLPGQVFIHFYGEHWPIEMTKPDFADGLAFHFAHEAAHLYQRQRFSATKGDAWMHEGAAEASAVIALVALDPAAAARRDRLIAATTARCDKARAGRSISAALEAGAFDAAYSCGMLVNLRIDAAIREHAPGKDGLFALWNALLARPGPALDRAGYFEALADVGGELLAAETRRSVEHADGLGAKENGR